MKTKYGTNRHSWLQNSPGQAQSIDDEEDQSQSSLSSDETEDPTEDTALKSAPSHPLEGHNRQPGHLMGVPMSFYTIYLPILTHTICTDMSTAVGSLFIFYSNARGWSNSHNAGSFAVALAVQSSLPLIFSPPISRLSNIFGPKQTMIVCLLISFFSLVAAFLVKDEAIFTMAVGLSALQGPAIQPMRLAYIHHHAPNHLRTLLLSIVALVGVAGTILSCIAIILYDAFLPPPTDPLRLWSAMDNMIAVDIDSCTITYGVAAVLTFGGIVFTALMLEPLNPSANDEKPSLPGLLPSHVKTKQEQKSFLKQIVSYFGMLVVGVWAINGMVSVTVMPTLVDTSGFQPADIALVGFAVSLLSMVPPIVITMFPHWKDRNVMLASLMLQMIGVLTLCFGPWAWLQAVAGYLIVSHATTYFYMASMSVYSLLATQYNESDKDGTLLKLPNLCQSGGLALGQFIGGFVLFYWFQTYWMVLMLAPCFVILLAIAYPWFWVRLDPPYGQAWLSNEDSLDDGDGDDHSPTSSEHNIGYKRGPSMTPNPKGLFSSKSNPRTPY